jgi:hypothetical protein
VTCHSGIGQNRSFCIAPMPVVPGRGVGSLLRTFEWRRSLQSQSVRCVMVAADSRPEPPLMVLTTAAPGEFCAGAAVGLETLVQRDIPLMHNP